ncbi:PREDICTED: uncharacterized protein LOC109238874 [Nicotiana attenuata]|uniref:PHD-type zinc finger plants domain-containing protein n=1 Tax=Nicotiana attenuata TaxID=49451 RepID=A0A314LB47_NICAT|nr:PREDICTED: uncharacterized protein LOC109238874 [Nicotiana attenuata]OIT38845.1 hypothetical protein A4A49_23946 [Nicotiana attenuata]
MTSSRGATECCMCGDYGLSSQLFKCKICQSRSQHRYCSNLYPKAESYRICNWCLSPKEVSADKTHNSSNYSSSSSSCRNTSDDIQDGPIKFKKKLIIRNENNIDIGIGPSPKGSLMKLQLIKKTQKSMERSPSLAARKRDTIEEKIRRTISNTGITRKVLKNRVRRYKLLDEVSS